jgi:hypothetical protein
MNLKEFRDKFPWMRPNALVHSEGEILECTSWPWDEEDGIYVLARFPNDPPSVDAEKATDLRPVTAKCERDNTAFMPIVQPYPGGRCFIECPTCSRRYFQTDDKWISDRPLTLLEN